MSKFYKFVKAEAGTELLLEGVIASESWYDDEVSPKAFRDELQQHSGDLTVRVNSPGGDVYAGVSIYNMLNEHSGKVTVKVDGIAASIASLIAMAGDRIIMLPGSQMMVHQPWTVVMGNSDELAASAESLQKVCDSMISIYATRTGNSEEDVLQLLKGKEGHDGTLMTANEAVELGFADEAVIAKSKPADMNALSNLLASINNAVMQPVMSINTRKVEASDATDSTEEVAEVVTEESEAPSAEESEQPEAEEVTEAEVAEVVETTEEVVQTEGLAEPIVEEIKAAETKEIKAMSKEQEIALEGVQASLPKQDVTPVVDAKAWFKSKDSVEAFTMALANNPGKSFQDEAVQASYRNAQVNAGIVDPSVFTLPEPVITSIEDAVKSGDIYSKMNHTGLDVYKLVWDDTDADANTSRAGGFNPTFENGGNIDRTKEQQILDFEKRVIRAQYIYKYLVLGKETIRENRSTGALVRFVLNELPVRVVRELERAAIIGDGRLAGSKRKITSFVSVKADAASGTSPFATTYTPQVSETRYESLVRAMAEIEAEGPVYLIHKKGFLTDLLLETNANGGYIFAPGTDTARALGFAGAIQPTWFNDTTDPDNDAYLVVLNKYFTVGDNSIEAFTNFKLETNENEFLQEIYKGGALAAVNAAVAIASIGS